MTVFKVGDRVCTKDGGPTMRVSAVGADGLVTCEEIRFSRPVVYTLLYRADALELCPAPIPAPPAPPCDNPGT